MKILIVEDNKILSNNISKYLEIKWIKNKAIHLSKLEFDLLLYLIKNR